MPRIAFLALSFIIGCTSDAAQEAQDLAQQAAEAAKKASEAAKKAAEAAEMPRQSPRGTETPASAPTNLAEAMAQMQDVLKQQGGSVEPVSFRELKAMLPEAVGDLPRTKTEGQKSGAFGFKVSTAQARYRKGPARVDLKVTDMGGAQAFAGATAAAWTVAEIDREWDDGYERTTTLNGHKAFEKYNAKTQRSELQLVVAGRFMVEAKGRQVNVAVLRGGVTALPLDKLAQKQKTRPSAKE